MKFLKSIFQRVRNWIRAIKRYFRRPGKILEVEAEVPEPFPLLELPNVVLRKIFHHLDPLTLIDLSMTSDKVHENMKEIKLPADEFFWDFCKDRMLISCFFKDSLIMFLSTPDNLERPIVERRIGGKVRLVNMRREEEEEPDHRLTYEFQSSRRLRSEEEAAITAHLLDIIKPKKYCLRLSGERNLIDLFVWKFSTNFDSIGLDPKYVVHRFGPSDAQFLFQEVVVREISIDSEREVWKPKRKAKLLDAIRTMQLRKTIQNILVWNFDLLFSAENIINSEIKFLVVFYCSEDSDEPVFYKELNKIMKAWQEGEKLTQLEKIDTSCKRMPDEELESLLEDIDWTSETPNHPQFEDFVETHGLVRDSLIRRRTDGQLASLSKYKSMFLFVVWKEGDLRLKPIYFQDYATD